MFFDFSNYGERYLQCSTRDMAVQFRGLTCFHGVQKSVELQLERFGLFYVDFKTQKRTPKLSAAYFREAIARNAVV